MSDETENKIVQQDADSETAIPIERKSSIKTILLIMVCLIVILSGIGYFVKDKLNVLAEHKHGELAGLSSDIELLKNKVNELREQQAGLVSSIDVLIEAQSGIEKNIAVLYQGQNNTNQEWALAEVEYLLLIASHRLLLESDIATALAAMQAADKRLLSLPDPGLLSVRKQLTTDMNSLQAVSKIDIAGLALYLADLVARVDDLPLRDVEIKQQSKTSEMSATEVVAPWWKRLFSSVWQELKGVIIISHEDQQTELSLLPQQAFFLRQNLRLQMESARYAVLRRDTDGLRSAAGLIENWLVTYFDTADSGIANILEFLSKMHGLELNPAVPDVSSSLETVRAYIRASAVSESGDTGAVVQ